MFVPLAHVPDHAKADFGMIRDAVEGLIESARRNFIGSIPKFAT
jgi:hypothetical protein